MTQANKQRQIEKFRKAARELETDLDEDEFKNLVKKVAEAPEPDKEADDSEDDD